MLNYTNSRCYRNRHKNHYIPFIFQIATFLLIVFFSDHIVDQVHSHRYLCVGKVWGNYAFESLHSYHHIELEIEWVWIIVLQLLKLIRGYYYICHHQEGTLFTIKWVIGRKRCEVTNLSSIYYKKRKLPHLKCNLFF
jgi:hypothetical protein